MCSTRQQWDHWMAFLFNKGNPLETHLSRMHWGEFLFKKAEVIMFNPYTYELVVITSHIPQIYNRLCLPLKKPLKSSFLHAFYSSWAESPLGCLIIPLVTNLYIIFYMLGCDLLTLHGYLSVLLLCFYCIPLRVTLSELGDPINNKQNIFYN